LLVAVATAAKGRLTHEAKVRKMALILQDEVNGIRRLGVGMIGPIQLKLRYQGIVRNVLIEDPVTPGTPVEYDVWDDLGQAYIMSGTEGEVRVTPFEGKRVPVRFFRIASRPAIRKEDLYYLRINAVEQAQDETKQAIHEAGGRRLMVLLQAAISDYATRPDHDVTPNHTVTETSGYFTPQSLYTAVAQTDQHEMESGRILVNPLTTGTSSGGTSTRPAGPSRTASSPVRRSPRSASSRSSARSSSPRGQDVHPPEPRLPRRVPGALLARRRGEPPGRVLLEGLGVR
jgi:hypothetical protein